MGGGKSDFVQCLQKSGTKHAGQSKFIEQILIFFLFPLFSDLIDTATGNNEMNMGVVIQAPSMRMQNSGHANIGAKIFGICSKVFQSARSARKHKVINKRLVIPGQESEFKRKCESRHEVVDRQKLGLLPIQPDGGFMVLTLWAAAMPAGARLPCCVSTLGALHQKLAGLWCPASADRFDGAQMTGQKL